MKAKAAHERIVIQDHKKAPPTRSIADTLLGISIAAGITYAQADVADIPERLAGTLTCMTQPNLSLVCGRSSVADCTFAFQAGAFRQDYQALLPQPRVPGPTSSRCLGA